MKNLFLLVVFNWVIFFSFGQKKEQTSDAKVEERIFDMANLLTADQERNIFKLIQDLEINVGSKIGIITIESLNGQTIEAYAKDQANRMGLFGKKKRDGLLIVFAIKDGKLRTEVSVGLDKIITDEVASVVNQGVIAPQFKALNYANGFYNGIKAFKERIEANKELIGR